MRSLSGTETTLMESCLGISLGITGESVRGQGARTRDETPHSVERAGPQTTGLSDGGGRPSDQSGGLGIQHGCYTTTTDG
jgi:hypothetical protein